MCGPTRAAPNCKPRGRPISIQRDVTSGSSTGRGKRRPGGSSSPDPGFLGINDGANSVMAKRPGQAIKTIASRAALVTGRRRIALTEEANLSFLACFRDCDGGRRFRQMSATARPAVMRIGSVCPSNPRTHSVGRANFTGRVGRTAVSHRAAGSAAPR